MTLQQAAVMAWAWLALTAAGVAWAFWPETSPSAIRKIMAMAQPGLAEK